MAGCIKMPLGMEVGLSPGDSVFDGDPAPLPKKGADSQFSVHVYCGQTAAWIKMPHGTEVGLGPDDIVLDGDPAPPPQQGGGALYPIFYCDQTTGWIKMALGMDVDPGSGLTVL